MRSVSDYAKELIDKIETAETPKQAETASWILEATIRTILEEKGVRHHDELDQR